MPDLDIVGTWTCSTNTYWHKRIQGSEPAVVYDVRFQHRPMGPVQYDWTCTCKAFTFGKGKYCKHIKSVMEERCGWNAELEPTAEALVKDGEHVCPNCEGPVEAFRVGV